MAKKKIGNPNSFISKEDLESSFCLRVTQSLSLQLCPHTCCMPQSQRYSRVGGLPCFTVSCALSSQASQELLSLPNHNREQMFQGRFISCWHNTQRLTFLCQRLVNVINTLKRALGVQVLSQNERRLHRNVSWTRHCSLPGDSLRETNGKGGQRLSQVIIKAPCEYPQKQHNVCGVGKQAGEPDIAEFQCQLYHLVLPLGKSPHFSEQTVLTNIVIRCK